MKTPILLLATTVLVVSPASMHAQTAAPATGAAPSAETAQSNTADDLWRQIQELKKGPAQQPKSKEEFAGYLRKLDAAAQDFSKRFPSDPRRWDAKMLDAQITGPSRGGVCRVPPQSRPTKMESVAKEIVSAPDASAVAKGDARFVLLQIELTKEGATPDVEKNIAAFTHDFPGDPRTDSIKLYFAKKAQSSDPAKADTIFQELTKSINPQVASQATAALKLKDLTKKPLDLKYTAIDGTEIDLAKMRGKVVLVDFWATWCGPCMGEVPNVVAAYKKYHDKGFEVVGISLDQDKDAVLRVTKEKGMTWPQYFDGKGWHNSISSSFGINSIPAMWLVNKDGLIATTDARENLESEIEKLLAK